MTLYGNQSMGYRGAQCGYRFVSWADDVTDNPRTVTAHVNGAIYSAIFEAIA